jgi:hypothetical protein
MMLLKTQKARSIRFRRWSRAGYAVFCSLTCCVTIGSLSVSVSDSILQKTNGITRNEVFSSISDLFSAGKEVVDPEVLLQKTSEVLLPEMSNDGIAACGQSECYYINCNG